MVTGPGLEADVQLTVGPLALDVQLSVAPGELVAVLGPNGAGKSTLLRALAGLVPIERGRIGLGGETLDEPATATWVPTEHRPIGVVFQDLLLFPHLTVLENVAFGVRARGRRRAEAERLAAGWLTRVGLADRAGDRPGRLSGGQAQRVALARALATEPRLLLLDEPLSALDASTRLATRRDLTAALAGYDGVRILVTHDPLEAMALADRLVVIEDGRVVQTGTAATVVGQPRSRYVADLVGVNLLRGTGRAGRIELAVGGALVAADTVDGPLLAVVHPRAITLHRRPPEGTPRNVWQGTAAGVDLEGARARVRIEGPIPVVAEVTPAAVDDLDLRAGGPVWVSVKATDVQTYPA